MSLASSAVYLVLLSLVSLVTLMPTTMLRKTPLLAPVTRPASALYTPTSATRSPGFT